MKRLSLFLLVTSLLTPAAHSADKGTLGKRFSNFIESCDKDMPVNKREKQAELLKSDSFCKGATVAKPVGDWRCRRSKTIKACKASKCERTYECVPGPKRPAVKSTLGKRIPTILNMCSEAMPAGRREKHVEMLKSDYFCKGDTVAEAKGAWRCRPAKALEEYCEKGLTCERTYECVARAAPRVRKDTLGKRFPSVLHLCSEAMPAEKVNKHFQLLESDFFCSGKTIAKPVGDWRCGPSKGIEEYCEKALKCERIYECVRETKKYNRRTARKEKARALR